MREPCPFCKHVDEFTAGLCTEEVVGTLKRCGCGDLYHGAKDGSAIARTWRGQKIHTEAELKNIDFPYPPEPE